MNAVEKLLSGGEPTRGDVLELLTATDAETLFGAAREMRARYSGDRVFMYGFVYFSTYCRNNCNFCFYRRDNDIPRYRKSADEAAEIGEALARDGVNLLDLTMGEDPVYRAEGLEPVLELVKRLKRTTGLPLMLSAGVISHSLIDRFAEAGADWFALYQETHSRALYARLRVGQDYDERMDAKLYARSRGMLIEEGLLAGVGDTDEDAAKSILEMKRIGAKQVRVMSFVPQKGSPMADFPAPDRARENRIIAALRLVHRDALIPASLDVDGIAGLRSRIDAGANLVTSIIPPLSGLMGVAQPEKDVDGGGRTVSEVSRILREMGLVPATADEYRAYLERLRADKA